MCFYYDDGHLEFRQSSIVKCRKPHQCEGCGRKIQPGEFAVSESGKFEGDMFSLHCCGRCKLNQQRIHEHELKEGCSWRSSWIAYYEIYEYLNGDGEGTIVEATDEEGQEYLRSEREKRITEKRNAKAVLETGGPR